MKRITKILALAAVVVLAMVLIAGCSSESSNENTANEEETNTSSSTATETNTNTNATTNENANTNTASSTLGDDFTLIVGLDNSYPPYGFIGDDGELTGFDIDLATEVAERNGWNLDLEAIDWDTKDALLNQGTINAIWNGFTMEGREDSYTFSEPYMLNEQVIVVKSDSGITSWDDLAGLTVMTQVDSAALDLLEDEDGQKDLADTFGSLEQISDYNNAFMQLDSGMVDAVACDLSIAEYQMAANPDEYVMLDPLNSEHYAVGVQKGNTELADAISETLLEMYNDGTIAELCEKWSDYGITIDNWVLTS